jgi:hypothetical protein
MDQPSCGCGGIAEEVVPFASIDGTDHGERGQILPPRTRHPSTAVVHRVVDQRVSSTSFCDRTYHRVSKTVDSQEERYALPQPAYSHM